MFNLHRKNEKLKKILQNRKFRNSVNLASDNSFLPYERNVWNLSYEKSIWYQLKVSLNKLKCINNNNEEKLCYENSNLNN